MTTIAIMQPTFVPWLGYLDLMDAVDVWVSLDDVQFSHQSWQHRNRVRSRDGLTWITVPVRGDQRHAPLGEVLLAERTDHPEALLRKVDEAYRQAPHHALARWLLEPLAASRGGDRLVDLNHALLDQLRIALEVATPMQVASSLGCGGTRTAHLVEICRALHATTYVTPPGSLGYLSDERGLFEDAAIEVVVQVYEHPTYTQCFTPFLSHASSVDLIGNVGPDAGEVMRTGRRPHAALTDALGVER